MTAARFDALTIGNAIVDIIARCSDDFLARNGIIKAAMNLIDGERAERLYSAMGARIETSGGSAGNTAAGVAGFGGKAAYIGKVADDPLGAVYDADIRAQGVHFSTAPLIGGAPTARSMIFVTPDGERSMNTYLGACVELGPEDIDEAVVSSAAITYFEGYLWDPPRAKEAIRKAAGIAHAHGRKTAITLSDSFCVNRYRDEFLDLIQSKTVDIVFANEDELKALYEVEFEQAVTAISRDCALAAVTRSEKGAIVIEGDKVTNVAAERIVQLVDATGAGDAFAAGFLFGHARGFDGWRSAKLGIMAATHVIQKIGPRADVSLERAALSAGLL
jgi:sugar/nucleoside kinase (ribokinase family)